MVKGEARYRVQPRIRPWTVVFLVMAANCWMGSAGLAATMNFESLEVGTRFGSAVGHERNEIVLESDGIAMSVDALFFTEEFFLFGYAEVDGRKADTFPTNALELSNLSVVFDFTGLGFSVESVTIEYRDIEEGAAINNFAVNARPIHILGSLTGIPVAITSDVTATVTGTALAGSITLEGPVQSFRIGGQELYIDNITAVPEPTTLLLLAMGAGFLTRKRAVFP